ncbi:MAG: hypothetical protein NVS1B13_11720 [Flavisolibacter sp.]
MWINKETGYLQDWITQVWVKATGKKYNPAKNGWLDGPIGDTKIIKDKFIERIAIEENLDVVRNIKNSGLLEDFGSLQLTETEIKLINPKVVDFYERTFNYHFEIWSEWCGFFKPVGFLLSKIFSTRLQQLNLPLSSLDSSKGIDSNIIKLVEKGTGLAKWTVRYRILKSTNKVIYAGVYTTCEVPNFEGKFLKVVFPLPNGNAIVIMRKEILSDGSLKLCSDGLRFGDNGFYFTLTNHKGMHWLKFVRAMHEWITVYVDDEDVLRANHDLYFYGRPFLKLHYKMLEKKII